ncbi:hypothetical protein [Streptomyces cylindrosporus]|uniref:Uncharacterized protein n=1 Tax=Streptomyces cylindrosporus TaxID=2927583 RepID=A0ABS9YK66_9ACTN|nr:hypothetical protein [Streptomyces cylindrosporus]MCI3277655.1 hypothetical protein [Streptomyces cylindrosporus]
MPPAKTPRKPQPETPPAAAQDTTPAEPADTEETPPAAAPEPTPDEAVDPEQPTGLLDPGVYEYTHVSDCVYPHVPLTARAARPERPATDDDPGAPAVAATVFDWAFGAPDDGRWTPTRKKPNQAADNEPAPSSEE